MKTHLLYKGLGLSFAICTMGLFVLEVAHSLSEHRLQRQKNVNSRITSYVTLGKLFYL